MMSQEQFKNPQDFWRKQRNPATPLPEIRNTGSIKYDLLQQEIMANEETGKSLAIKITGPVKTHRHTTYSRPSDQTKACDVVICAINHNMRICLQLYPKEIFVCQSFYEEIAADFATLFSDPFEGYFPVYGALEPIPIGIDSYMRIGLPFGTVLCIN